MASEVQTWKRRKRQEWHRPKRTNGKRPKRTWNLFCQKKEKMLLSASGLKLPRGQAIFSAEGIDKGIHISKSAGKCGLSDRGLTGKQQSPGMGEAYTAQVIGKRSAGQFLKKPGKVTVGKVKMCSSAF